MSIGNAINSGVLGLQSYANSMGVIGNNLANANSTGYKTSRTLFSDLMPQNVFGSAGTSQVGKGVNLSIIDTVFSQGAIENTGSSTDLAIEGPGFFIVKSPGGEENHYTRAGAFRLDNDGKLINPEGYIVQGFESRKDGTVGALGDIVVNTLSYISPQATSEVSMTTNLNSESEIMTWDPTDPSGTSNFAATTSVYDSLGSTHLITTFFTKTGENRWAYHQAAAVAEIANAAGNAVLGDGSLVLIGNGELTMDGQGLLAEITANGATTTPPLDLPDPQDPTWPNIVIDGADLDWNNGANNQNQSIDFALNLTQFATESVVVTQRADGNSVGNFSKIAIDSEGVITGYYTNGESKSLAKIALAKFANNNGLAKIGMNLFEATTESGTPDIGTSGSGVGTIYSNALERSTVDIAEEFAKLILTQRSFQANSKIITTTDEMLGEIINLKR